MAQTAAANQSTVQQDKMASLSSFMLMVFAITLLGEGFGVTDEEFKVSYIVL